MIALLTVIAALAAIVIFKRRPLVPSLIAVPVVTAYVFTLGAAPLDSLAWAGTTVLVVLARRELLAAFTMTFRTLWGNPTKAKATR